MVQGRGRLRLLGEPAETIRIGSEARRQHLDGDLPPEHGVPGPVHLAHAAGAERRENLAGTKSVASGEAHRCWRVYHTCHTIGSTDATRASDSAHCEAAPRQKRLESLIASETIPLQSAVRNTRCTSRATDARSSHANTSSSLRSPAGTSAIANGGT